MTSVLVNGSFEQGACRDTFNGITYNEIEVPESWIAWWSEGSVFYRPEMKVITNVPPYVDPQRIYSGEKSLMFFGFYKKIRAGVYQQVTVQNGSTLHLSAYAHSWYSQLDDPHKSQWVDEYGNIHIIPDGGDGMELSVGIDTTGGVDPHSPSVVWGTEKYYEGFGRIELEAEASGQVTIFLKGEAQYPFKHCDCYFDAVTLEVDPPQPQVCRGAPRVQFDRTFVLFPEDTTIDQFDSLIHTSMAHGHTFGRNADDAGMGDLDNKHVFIVWATPTSWNRAEIEAHFRDNYPGTTFEHLELFSDPDDDDDGMPQLPPPSGWTPRNYVPTGTKLGFHCVGGYPLDRVQTLAQAGVLLPTVKFLTSLGDLNAAAEPYRIARVIDAAGANAEGFDYNGDPIAQAEARMAQLMPVFAPYKSRLGWIEIVNEQAPPYPGTHVKIAQFYIEAMRMAEANGYKLALFSHSVGNPTHAAWDEIADTGIFEMAAAGGHAISLHEYGDAQGGPTNVICWYRYLYETHILPRRLDIPLFITEYNAHDVLIGMPNLITQWAAYDALVSQDPYVAGVHLYTLGIVPGPFQERTVAALADFVSYAIAVKDRVNS